MAPTRRPSSCRPRHPSRRPQAKPSPLPPSALHFATTQYAGAFLLLPQALRWRAVANDCFTDDYGTLERGLLTSVFAPLVGLGRIFHCDPMNDLGFAWLSGGRRCPSRYPVGGWRRHLSWHEVDAFCRRTAAWEWVEGEDALVSFDDHVIPRWTRKFRIPKGFSTTRNKHRRCEKLFFGYDVGSRRFLCVRATPGNVGRRDLSVSLTRRVLREGRPRSLHALFDAAAGKSDADVRALWDRVEDEPTLTVTLRACRYPTRLAQWKQLPSGLFVAYEEPGPYVGAPAKEIRLADQDLVVPVMKKLQERFEGKIKSASFDRGFHTPENQQKLGEIVGTPCIATKGQEKGRRQQKEGTVAFRKARQSHPGVESVIGALQSGNGLQRCRDRSRQGFERYIGLGILGRNLQTLGKLLLAQNKADCQAAKSKRKRQAS
ncbi:MAG TPA: hypothetical protein VKA46_20520 [Gemmataceae bacterium]|nr:hypothetical protein [Gemmataceae bacterium]